MGSQGAQAWVTGLKQALTHVRYPCRDPDEVYDDVEPTDHSGPGPRSRDEALSAQQYPWRPPQNPELRKEKVPLQPPQVPPTDLKSLKQLRKAEKAEREFRKKFKV